MCRWVSLHIYIPAAAFPEGSDQILCSGFPDVMVSHSGYFICSFLFIAPNKLFIWHAVVQLLYLSASSIHHIGGMLNVATLSYFTKDDVGSQPRMIQH